MPPLQASSQLFFSFLHQASHRSRPLYNSNWGGRGKKSSLISGWNRVGAKRLLKKSSPQRPRRQPKRISVGRFSTSRSTGPRAGNLRAVSLGGHTRVSGYDPLDRTSPPPPHPHLVSFGEQRRPPRSPRPERASPFLYRYLKEPATTHRVASYFSRVRHSHPFSLPTPWTSLGIFTL